MIRNANFSDIPAVVRIIEWAYRSTPYALKGLASVDVGEAKRLLMNSIQRHGGKNGGACWVQVADSGAAVTGFILGTLTRVYSVGDRLMATDLFWICTDEADPRDGPALMRGMLGWAKENPAVVEITCATTSVMGVDPAKAGALLERLGMSKFGNIYQLRVAQ